MKSLAFVLTGTGLLAVITVTAFWRDQGPAQAANGGKPSNSRRQDKPRVHADGRSRSGPANTTQSSSRIQAPRPNGTRPSHAALSGAETGVQDPAQPYAGLIISAAPGSGPEAALRAAEVEAEARAQLDALTERYRLTPQQREEAFPLVARSLPSFDPAFVVGGASVATAAARTTGLSSPNAAKTAGVGGSSPAVPLAMPAAPESAGSGASDSNNITSTTGLDEQIHALLEPQQEMEAASDAMDKILWWEEIMARLEDELDRKVAAEAQQQPAATTDAPSEDNQTNNPMPPPPAAPTDEIPGLPAE